MKKAFFLVLLLVWAAKRSEAADWPMYRHDAQRSGYTPEKLPAKLSLLWTFRTRHAPQPAWPRSNRLPFDRAYQPVIAGGLVFFGSSADGKLYALDAATGTVRWTYFTDGPIRFAPAADKDRLFVASDDGHLYCLAARSGKVLWQKRGGPRASMLLGNGQMISRWPARGGPVVAEGKVYFAAGIWPSEGVYLYALDVGTGRETWANTSSGTRVMDQPHGGARARSGVSAQGYLAVAGEVLLVPTGRAVPAAFGRSDGTLRYFHLQRYGHYGGSAVMVAGEVFINQDNAFETRSGQLVARRVGGPVVALPGGTLVRYRRKSLGVCIWATKRGIDRKGKSTTSRVLKEQWSVRATGGAALIAAGRMVISGGLRKVTAVDTASRTEVWSAAVDGTAYGLAVANGRLYVSTDQGTIYCFGAESSARPRMIEPPPPAAPYGANETYAAAADEILAKCKITRGYCLDLDCGEGALAYELAKRTQLRIYAVSSDPAKVARARKRLDAAGLYGVRVSVHQRSPRQSAYPNYFANLVVSGRSVRAGSRVAPRKEVNRMLRPYGGAACLGKPRAMRKTVRGALEGAGSWTHQYGNPANTSCSDDRLVRGSLGMLWFNEWTLAMPQRHGRGPAPLFSDGRLFVEGLHALRAVDAYNGALLWEYPLKDILTPYNQDHLVGTAGTGSNFCVAGTRIYVRTGSRCLQLDAASGEKLREYKVPPLGGRSGAPWGFLACVEGTLYGSSANERHVVRWAYRRSKMQKLFTESTALFALDVKSGRTRWTYAAKHSLRHNAIAIGARHVYLIDRPAAAGDRTGNKGAHPTGELIALDAKTGRVRWRTAEDIYGTMLALSEKYGVLLMSYQPTRFKLPSERGGRMTAYRATDGKLMWNERARYGSRPLINERTVYAQPGAWDLLSGKRSSFRFSRSYGCGTVAGARNLLVFRSATLGYLNLRSGRGGSTENYGGLRPGCWINAIPAGGLVLMPDASSGCGCSYLLKASIVLQPMK